MTLERRSRRLNLYSQTVVDMVNYADIGMSLVHHNILTLSDHEVFLNSLDRESALENLIRLLHTRQNGFEVFIKVLRECDYNWLAEQLDPNGQLTNNAESELETSFFTSSARNTFRRLTLRKRGSIQSTTKGDSFRKSVNESFQDSSSTSSSCQNYDLDFLLSDLSIHSPRPDERNDKKDKKTNTLRTQANRNSVLIYNVPGATQESTSRTDITTFLGIAKRLSLPRGILEGLRVIRTGRVSKEKKSTSPIQAKFKSENAKNQFLECVYQNPEVMRTTYGDIKVVPFPSEHDMPSNERSADVHASPITITPMTQTQNPPKHSWHQKYLFGLFNKSKPSL